jgi:hypothetical protein
VKAHLDGFFPALGNGGGLTRKGAALVREVGDDWGGWRLPPD